MNSRQRDLVRESLHALRPISKEFGAEFYERLFRLDPSLRPLFSSDLANQESMFVTALHGAALGLVEDGAVPAAMRELGERHARYGATGPRFATFRDAFLATLAGRLGGAFTPEMREAWAEAYDLLADAMRDAGARARFGPEVRAAS